MMMPDYFRLMAVGDGLFIVLALVCFVTFFKQRIQRRTQVGILTDAIDSSMGGVVLFDQRQRYWRHNSRAERFLPVLAIEKERPRTVSQLLAYMQDNGVDLDASTRKVLDKSLSYQDIAQGFSEVIGWGENNTCLVRVQRTTGGGTIFVMIDISHSRTQEEKLMHLSQTNHELAAAVESIKSGVIISDPRQNWNPVVFVNQFLADIVGLPKHEIIGNDWRFILDALGNYDIGEQVENAFKRRETVEIEFSPVRGRDKQWFSLQVSPVLDEGSKTQLFVGILTDITAVKVREASYFQAQRLEALGQLAGGVAHDFNNVLSIIDGYSRLSQNACESCDKKTCDYLTRIRVAVDRGAGLTQRLLAFGRHSNISETAIDVGALVLDQLSLIKPLVGEDIRLAISIPDDTAYVKCSADAVSNILMNLVVNAKDAMPGGGQITIRVEVFETDSLPSALKEVKADGSFVRLSVSDTGEGIPKEILGKVFDPFFTTKATGRGTGLGLSMVYGLVKEMNGYIEVDSAAGEGTTMSIFIPVAECDLKKEPGGCIEDISTLRFDGYTALVVEDEPDLLMLVSTLLEGRGMNVLKASSGSEALVLQDEFEDDIDLLLTDVVMPGLNGIKTMELICSLRPETAAIFMSGYPSCGEMARYVLPADACLVTKPIKEKELLSKIHNQLTQRQALI